MNNMTEKLIEDSREARRAKLNLISTLIGAGLFLGGIICLLIRAVTGSYLDTDGILHEYFFLIPMAFIFFFAGFVTFLVVGIRNNYIAISFGVVGVCIGAFLMLIASNSGKPLEIPSAAVMGAGIAEMISGCVRVISKKSKKTKRSLE